MLSNETCKPSQLIKLLKLRNESVNIIVINQQIAGIIHACTQTWLSINLWYDAELCVGKSLAAKSLMLFQSSVGHEIP